MSLQDFPEQKVKAKLLELLNREEGKDRDREDMDGVDPENSMIRNQPVEQVHHGKVRDVYLSKNYCLLKATDRISAFDYSLERYPLKDWS